MADRLAMMEESAGRAMAANPAAPPAEMAEAPVEAAPPAPPAEGAPPDAAQPGDPSQLILMLQSMLEDPATSPAIHDEIQQLAYALYLTETEWWMSPENFPMVEQAVGALQAGDEATAQQAIAALSQGPQSTEAPAGMP